MDIDLSMNSIDLFGITISPEKYQYLLNIPQEKLFSWLEAGINILPNFVVALITLLMFYPFAKIAKFLAGKISKRTSDNVAVHDLFKNIVFLVVFFIGVFSALEILNLEKTVASLLAGAGVIGLALGFAFQEIASNFVSGILIAFKKPYRIGDFVEIQGHTGKVNAIDLRTTSILTPLGHEVIVPNNKMITEPLVNYTSTPGRKVEIIVGVSYKSDLKKVEEIAKKALENLEHRIHDRPIEFFYTQFGPSSIDFRIEFWIEYPRESNYPRSIHQAIINIKNAFDQNNIEIPYPIRTLDMSMSKDFPRPL